ncbi:hypothetical protein D3C78_1831840 [compost metagenome]
MGIAGGHHKVDFVHRAGKSTLTALHVGHQGGVLNALHTLDTAHDLLCIAQVRDGLGGGE